MIGLRRFLPAVVALALLSGSGGAVGDVPVPSTPDDAPPAPKVYEAVTYRTVGQQDLKLDIAVPPGDGPFPVIVYLHGGGWLAGDRSRFRDEIEVAASRGYVGVTVSYRLCKTGEDTPSVDGFPAALHDVKAAVRFLRANATRYKIDPKRIGVGGESAGGHLALLLGLTRPQDGLEGEDVPPDAPSSAVQAVVNVFGPTDMAALGIENPKTRPVLVMLLGAQPEAAPDRYRRASPVTYARKDAPPILTIQGSADGLVPASQARSLDAALRKVGARHELIVLHGAGHRFYGPHATRAAQAFYDFFDRTLKHPAR